MASQTCPVVIGQEDTAQTLHVHKDALLKSRCFKAFLTAGFAEAQLKKISLPDDDVDAVKSYVSWLYTKVFTYTHTHEGDPTHTQLWRFADKVCDEAYRNDLMDSMIKHYDQNRLFASMHRLRSLYGKGLGKTQVAKFSLATNVWEAVNFPDNWKKKSTFYEMAKDPGEGFNELTVDFVNQVILPQTDKEKLADPRKLKGCHFHEHKDGSPCSKANEKK